LANGCNIPTPPYKPCDITVDQGWAYSGPAVDVGDPVWSGWVDNGNGELVHTGTQATSRPMYHYIVDSVDDQKICSSEFKNEEGTRPLEETVPIVCEEGYEMVNFVCTLIPTPPVCEWNDQILATDPLCVESPPLVMCEWNDQLLASNPLCVEPPPSCEPYDTGQVLYQLHMSNTDPLHYGYFLLNSEKEGICQIVTNGNFPNATSVQTGCGCGMSAEFKWVTTSYDVLHVWKTCDGRIFYKNGDGQIVAPFGTFVFGQYCSSAECPIR
jgi:hypothetical protein